MNRNSFTLLFFAFPIEIGLIALSIECVPHLDRAQTVNFEPRSKESIDDSRGGTSRAVLEKCLSEFIFPTSTLVISNK